MTQNKLDGPRSGKLCKTFKLTKREKRERERKRGRDSSTEKDKEREIDHTKPWWPGGNAQKAHMGKEGRGCGLDSRGPTHAL